MRGVQRQAQIVLRMEGTALCILGKPSVIGAGPPALPYFSTPFLCVGIPYHIRRGSPTTLLSVVDQPDYCPSASLFRCGLEFFSLSLSFLIVKDQGTLQDDWDVQIHWRQCTGPKPATQQVLNK